MRNGAPDPIGATKPIDVTKPIDATMTIDGQEWSGASMRNAGPTMKTSQAPSAAFGFGEGPINDLESRDSGRQALGG